MNNTQTNSDLDTERKIKKAKLILFYLLMAVTIAFFGFMAGFTFINGSKNKADLAFVSGSITGKEVLKHRYRNRYGIYYKDLLVFSIEGNKNTFGILEYHDSFSALSAVNLKDEILKAAIWYDSTRSQIEGNICIHLYDFKINEKRYIEIEKVKKSEQIASLIFTLITVAMLLLSFYGVRYIKRN
jgi:hypothetical protein